MRTDRSIEVAASAATVWEVYADVERWPEWTASVRRLVPLDGAALEVGRRYRIEQPRLPTLVWTVTELEPGTRWAWQQRSPGAFAEGFHEVEPLGDDRTLVRLGVEQSGPVGTLVGWLTRSLTARYLTMEAEGLKAHSEARAAGS